MDPIVPRKMRIEIPVRVEKHANRIKYGVLAGLLAYYLVTKDVTGPIRYAEPFWMFSLFGTTGMWIGLALLLAATVFVRNLYCRFLCPVGAALGLISSVTTIFSIKRWSECKTCKLCEKTCEWGAIRGPLIVKSECVRCDDCERLYMDQQKCPHWLILYRRKGNTAVPSQL
jgi:polyferredoxin